MGTSINLETVLEAPAFTLHGGSAYGDVSEDVSVSWHELAEAAVGAMWEARNVSACVRASSEELAVVVYKDGDVTVVLHRRWSAGDSPDAECVEEVPVLRAYQCA